MTWINAFNTKVGPYFKNTFKKKSNVLQSREGKDDYAEESGPLVGI